MVNKKLINGLKYEKLSEAQLYDLSSWELVDIILDYRKDCKAKEQECEELQNKFLELNGKAYSNSLELYQLKVENEELKQAHYLAKEILKTLGVLDE